MLRSCTHQCRGRFGLASANLAPQIICDHVQSSDTNKQLTACTLRSALTSLGRSPRSSRVPTRSKPSWSSRRMEELGDPLRAFVSPRALRAGGYLWPRLRCDALTLDELASVGAFASLRPLLCLAAFRGPTTPFWRRRALLSPSTVSLAVAAALLGPCVEEISLVLDQADDPSDITAFLEALAAAPRLRKVNSAWAPL